MTTWTYAQRLAAANYVHEILKTYGQDQPVEEVARMVDTALDSGTRDAAFPLVRATINRRLGFFSFMVKDEQVKTVVDGAFSAAEKTGA